MKTYDKAMISTAEIIAFRFATALKSSGVKQSEIAIACNVSKQAVQGWLKTGRIDKKHLSKLADLTRTDLNWWLSSAPDKQPFSAQSHTIARSLASRIQAADESNHVSLEDWQLLELIVQKFTQKNVSAPEQLGAPIATQYRDQLEKLSEQAEEMHAKGIKHKVAARR